MVQILGAYLELYPEQELDDIYLFFDEIQELSGWEKYVHRIYDTVSKKIFLTGSNAKMLSQEIATSLRGRSLSFSEDRGQLLENLVFTKLRKDAEDIHFLKNGYECDFVVPTRAGNSIPVQVVDILHRDNFNRELRGLEKAR